MQTVYNFFGGYQPIQADNTDAMNMTTPSLDQSSSISFTNQSLYSTDYLNSQSPLPTPSSQHHSVPITPTPQFGAAMLSDSYNTSSSSTTTTITPTQSTSSTPTATTPSWLNSLWSSPTQDEMNTTYDVESQTIIQGQPQQKEQSLGHFQRLAVTAVTFLTPYTKYLPKVPELTYSQRLLSFAMFAIGGLFLFLNAMMNLPQIFFGGASKFTLSLTVSSLFFIAASLFVTSWTSHFTPARRFTTCLYISTLFAALFTSIYLPYALIVLPIVLLQVAALILHIISFFGSTVTEMNLGQTIITSIFRQAI